MRVFFFLLLLVAVVGCSARREPANESNTSPQAASQPTAANESVKNVEVATDSNNLKPGQASGTYTAKGETVQLHYAYAGRGKRFGEESVILLLTDQPVPADALAKELESQTLLLDEKIRGLEYVFSEGGFWVRFHPGQYQQSRSGEIKEYKVANGSVSGWDEDDGDLTDGKYKRSVRFVAALN
jgi:hypothetical protein